MLAAECVRELIGRFHAVLQRDCDRVFSDERLRFRGGVRNLPRFRREDDGIDRTDPRWIIGRIHAIDDEIAGNAVDAQSFRTERIEHRAARDEYGVDACLREFSAEVPANTTDADDCDFQSMRTTPSMTFGNRVSTAGS